METILRYGVFPAAAASLGILSYLVLRTLSFGKRRLHSQARGKRLAGVAYALGRGMMPWEKESAARHLPTTAAGMMYHAGIFSAILFVLLRAASVSVAGPALGVLRVLMAAGFACGVGLFVKRLVKPILRFLSCPDDFLSNALVDLFVLSGLLASFGAVPDSAFFALAVLTFLYMPLGKIRHCFFFFYVRILFGSYFGRRGVLPHPPRREV